MTFTTLEKLHAARTLEEVPTYSFRLRKAFASLLVLPSVLI